MRHQVSFKNFEPDPRLERILERLYGRIDRLVSAFKPEAVTVHVSLEKHTSRILHDAAVTLELPGKTLAANEENVAAEVALREAFREAERQLKRYKSDLRRERDRKRSAKREAARREMTAERAANE
jgi:ribosome-associated translation inhibitor RaiA